MRASAESWINKLIDLSRRNNLLFFRDLKTGKSVFQLQGELLRLPETAKTTLRFRGARLEALSSDKARRAEELLTELMAFEDLLTGASPSAWLKATRQDSLSLQGCLDQARSLTSEALPALRGLLTRAATEGDRDIETSFTAFVKEGAEAIRGFATRVAA